jgi:hypothetical protein
MRYNFVYLKIFMKKTLQKKLNSIPIIKKNNLKFKNPKKDDFMDNVKIKKNNML